MLLAIAGMKNSGKGVASDMLKYILSAPKPFRNYWFYKIGIRFPSKFKITSFAKPLKKVLSVILQVPESKFEDRTFKEKYYLQIGNFRLIEENLLDQEDKLSDNKFTRLLKTGESLLNKWLSIRQLMQYVGTEVLRTYLGENVWVQSTLKEHDNLIVSDLRFKNELKEVHALNGYVIFINRKTAKPGTHASEREVIDLLNNNEFDYIVDNNGSLKDLFNNIKKINTCLVNK